MATWVAGLIVTGEIICDGCGRSMKHPERYAYVFEDEQAPLRFCEECSRAREYMRPRRDEKGREVESYL